MTIPSNARTFLPKLQTILLLICRYIGQHRLVILEYLPPESEALLDAVITACVALEAVVDEQLP